MSVLGVVMARGGSRGAPGKNFRELGGRPLMAWTVRAGTDSMLLDKVVMASDVWAAEKIAAEYGVAMAALPEELTQDDSPRLGSLKYAIAQTELVTGKHYDVIVDLHADCPFRTASDIDRAIGVLGDADSVISVCEMQQYHPARMKWIDEQGCIRDFLPEPADGLRQNLTPKACVRAGGLYVYKREMVDAGRLFGHNWSVAYVMPWERAVNIDTELDWMVAECLLSTVRN